MKNCLAAFRELEEGLDSALDRYQVRYVALAADQTPATYLRHGWASIERGPSWQLWERARAVPGSVDFLQDLTGP